MQELQTAGHIIALHQAGELSTAESSQLLGLTPEELRRIASDPEALKAYFGPLYAELQATCIAILLEKAKTGDLTEAGLTKAMEFAAKQLLLLQGQATERHAHWLERLISEADEEAPLATELPQSAEKEPVG